MTSRMILCALVIIPSIAVYGEGLIKDVIPSDAYPRSKAARDAINEYDTQMEALQQEMAPEIERLRQELSQKLSTVRETAVTDGNIDEAEKTLSLEVDLPVSRILEGRHLWVHRSGFFQKLHNGLWLELAGAKQVPLIFRESGRSSRMVELTRINATPATIRLYGDRCEGSQGAKPFSRYYVGKWVVK
jgi:hypothetical protein